VWAGHPLLALITEVCIDGAGLGCLYLLVASIAVLRFPRALRAAHESAVQGPPPASITILKPLHGAEPDLPRRLTSFCRQDYRGPVQLLCGVHDCTDPAVEAVGLAKRCNPNSEIGLVADPSEHGSNRKVSNLANMVSAARYDVLVVSDSDIAVGPDYLTRIVSELRQPDVGCVTCLYHGMAGPGRWSRQAALAINSHFLPNVVFALSMRLAHPCFGSTIAMRRSMLARLGGFRAFRDCLADDFAIGEAVRAAGFTVAIPPVSIGHLCFHDRLRSMLGNEIRTARTIRTLDPIGYVGAILSHPFPLALIAAGIEGGRAIPLAVFALCCRAVLCLSVEHSFNVPRQPYWQIPARDLLSFWVYVAGLFGATVEWRGHSYRVDEDGKLFADQNNIGR
jgi:ceramide glucosyltransferase